jgi:glycosyltransferase involved in cell wall biosynthesis
MNADMQPLVSVVIPTYNHAHFLGCALQSVLDQTYRKWEAIVIDNHSQDNTDEVVQSFQDQRITLLKVRNNGVIAASRNMGIRAAQGDWIAFLDSDDFWYPGKLEIAINGIKENPSIDVCSTDEMLVNQSTGSRTLLKYGPYRPNFYRRLLVTGNCLSPSATLVRREFLNTKSILFRENAEFVTAEDYDLWMLLAQAGAKFHFIHLVQGEYLIHATNSSGQVERHAQNTINVIRDHVYKLQSFQMDRDRLWRSVNARLLLTSAINSIANMQFIPGIHKLILAFRSSTAGAIGFFFSRAGNRIGNTILRWIN